MQIKDRERLYQINFPYNTLAEGDPSVKDLAVSLEISKAHKED